MIDPENPPTRSHSPNEPTGPSEVSLSFHPDESHVGRYRLRRLLGKGGFGEVYLARDEELDRPVAIKVPHPNRITDPSDVEAYLAEARVTAQLDHPRIVPVYDFGRTCDGRCFIVSKYIEGTSLAQRIRGGRLGREEAIELVAAIAEALHHAHLQGIVHRDVKPGNILLDAAGNPYLTDFGLALREGDMGASPQVVGTISYTSPEQARGEGHRVDGRSDVFSLCVVLYELLTGRRPFVGKDGAEILDRVITMEPRPLRQLDDTIPKELERICMKGLSKRVAERYSAARDVADELRSFLEETPRGDVRQASTPRAPIDVQAPPPASESNLSPPVRIVPKGLRAYDAEDADFFLELLPGPRDRQGLPPSLLFWKQRIEAADPDQAFSVGVMYGPSGCGKTSIVRAGLLPRLADHVRAVLCEADEATTESRLLGRLRFVCPGLPHDVGLKESLTAIRRDPRIAQGKKVLLVLDQFEQWLHAHRSEERSELVQSLRQCDGRTVACLILVRDDFWLAISRFLRELEVPLVEGRNGALVDLFDTRHARKVLRAMGQAFGALSPEKLTRQESAFVDQAVAGLAENDRVVCVRLALFAEMMRSRPWTPASLRSIGGVTAVGARFLEETFAASTAPPEHRLHEKAARAVLESLLPEKGSQIKGRMRSYAELLQASGYAARSEDFRRLLQILDRELRLITPAEHDARPGEDAAAGRPADEQSFYQLTHDYLVPSLREWLQEKRSRTIRGRAELCLAERSRRWQADPDVRQLPSWWEWLRIRCLTRSRTWSQPQQRLMQAAGRRYLWRGAMWGAVALVLFVAGMELYGRYHASATVDRLLSAETADIPDVVVQLTPYYRWARSRLAAVIDDPEADPRKRLRAALALASDDDVRQREAVLDLLWRWSLRADSQTLGLVRARLMLYRDSVSEPLWRAALEEQVDHGTRLRAACLLAGLDPESPHWARIASPLTFDLLGSDPLETDQWASLLRALSGQLTGPLRHVFSEKSGKSSERVAAARILGQYVDLTLVGDLLLNADSEQYPMLAQRALSEADALLPKLIDALGRDNADELNPTSLSGVERQRNAAVTLMRLGRPEHVWPRLAASKNPTLRTSLILEMRRFGVPPDAIVAGWNANGDPAIRQAILLAVEPYRGYGLPEYLEKQIIDICIAALKGPKQAERSAAQWLLSRWGQAERAEEILKNLAAPPRGDWQVTRQGHTMLIVRGPVTFAMGSPDDEPGRESRELRHSRTVQRSFAVGIHPVTIEQFRRFRNEPAYAQDVSPDRRCPMNNVTWLDAIRYCRWLSEQEGIPEEQMCYPPVDKIGRDLVLSSQLLSRTGYRLPTEVEWEYVCRSGSETRWFCGASEDHVPQFAWFSLNSQERLWPVGLLRPNAFGLFDVVGNVGQWCHNDLTAPDLYEAMAPGEVPGLRAEPVEKTHQAFRGGGYAYTPKRLRSAQRYYLLTFPGASFKGFRVARTVRE